ncbi:MAG: DUF59 domain-containing protein [Elusimicrobia bacterium]|nr:DUF59 domain-containing protein [Elusimicrobiota bacterium]
MNPARAAALGALKTVVDPELGLDIVELGLLYALAVDEEAIRVRMTLTSPGCPLGETLLRMASQALSQVAGNRSVDLALVREPSWSPEMLGEEGRRRLGR